MDRFTQGPLRRPFSFEADPMEKLENLLCGIFLALFAGLSPEGAKRAQETVFTFLDHPDIPAEEAVFYRDLIECSAAAERDTHALCGYFEQAAVH
jgi:hypothetical protein